MSKPVRVRGYNDSLFEDAAAINTDDGISNPRSRRCPGAAFTLPPPTGGNAGGGSDREDEKGEEERTGRMPIMVEASTLTDIDDSDI